MTEKNLKDLTQSVYFVDLKKIGLYKQRGWNIISFGDIYQKI